MNNVADLSFFVTLAQAGTLSAAAQELGLSPAAVSRRLAALEARLGIRLLHRTTRRATLTHEGALYLEDGQRILADLNELETRLTGGQAVPQGLLRVNATFGFGRQFIAPAVADFVARHPGVEVQLQLTDRPLQLADDGIDVCIRFGDVPDARITSRTLVPNRRLLVASPAYLRRHAAPQTPAELRQHACIVIREADDAYGNWAMRSGAERSTIKVKGPLSTNDGEVALSWALRGLGILMRSQWHVAPYLRSGRLRQVLPEWDLPSADIHAVYPARQHLSAKVRAFVDHLDAHFAPYRTAQGPDGSW
jgi:LysR family transcriptional regulator, transcriptional activator for dmlA